MIPRGLEWRAVAVSAFWCYSSRRCLYQAAPTRAREPTSRVGTRSPALPSGGLQSQPHQSPKTSSSGRTSQGKTPVALVCGGLAKAGESCDSPATLSEILFLPWGSQEAHGPLLPPSTDTKLAEHVAHALAEDVPGGGVLPSLAYGCAAEHDGFPSTVSIPPEAALALVGGLLDSIARNAEPILTVVVIGHGGNVNLAEVAAHRNNYAGVRSKVMALHVFSEGARRLSHRLLGTFDAHAGSAESSAMAALGPGIEDGTFSVEDLGAEPCPRGSLRLFPSSQLSSSGVVTDLHRVVVSAEAGRQILERSIQESVRDVRRNIALIQDRRRGTE